MGRPREVFCVCACGCYNARPHRRAVRQVDLEPVAGGGATVKRSIFDRRYRNGQSAESVDRYTFSPPYDAVRGLGNTGPDRMGEVGANQSRAEGQECEQLLSVVLRTDTRNAKLTPKKVSYAAYYLC